MDVNGDFEYRHDVYMTVQFEMYGVKRIPSDKLIDALRMLDVCGEIVVKAIDMDNGGEIYKHTRAGVSKWN